MLPGELRLIALRFDNDCNGCGTRLVAGVRAYWSPAAPGRAWCERCVGKLRTSGTSERSAGNAIGNSGVSGRVEVPGDLRLITLKYDSDCATCGKALRGGGQGYWSAAARGRAWCLECGSTPADTDEKAHARFLKPRSAPHRGSRQDAPPQAQERWSRLCGYLSRCVLAEAANTLLAFPDLDKKGFLHDAEFEHLVTGSQDWTPVPAGLAARLAALATQRSTAAFKYGWPVLVARNQRNFPVIAPLFVVPVQVERREGRWFGIADAEPEFNLSIVAGELFDLPAREAIDAILGDGLPFGDTEGLTRVAQRIVQELDVRVVSDLDPRALTRQCETESGMYNAAVWLLADDGPGASRFLLKELDELATRTDWGETAAAALVRQGQLLGRHPGQAAKAPLAGPLPCNGSQESALHRTRHDPLTVVTGPPGTGKTQLVVNAVVNAWINDETVLVASTNNGAVDVAVQRAARDIHPGVLLRTGNRQIREALGDLVRVAVEASLDHKELGEPPGHVRSSAGVRAELARSANRRTNLLADLAAVPALNRKLTETVEELQRLAQELWKQDRAPALSVSSRVVERRARRVRRTWFFRRSRTRRLLAVVGCEEANTSLDDLVAWAGLDQARTALMHELATTEERIGDPATSLDKANDDWVNASAQAARLAVRTAFKDGKQTLASLTRGGLGGSSLAKNIRDCRRYARGWACTALSMNRSFPLEPGFFDLVVIDEASQCSLATALPLAYRAKRLAVIGDPNQLTPVITLSGPLLRKIAAGEEFDDHDLARRGVHYKEGSAYRAFARAVESDPQQPVVLDEHYRCHPYIARWFNREFYAGELTVLTDIARMPSARRSIGWIDVRGTVDRGGAASWINVAEAERAVREVAALVRAGCESVGVVAPFAAQAALIDRMARHDEHLGDEKLAAVDFASGTAHRFQGGERDAIVVSAVLSPEIPRRTAAWVEHERYLINVAVSRAKQSLVVLGHPEIGPIGSPTMASLRTYLRDTVIADGGKELATDNVRTDSRAEARLLVAMRNVGWQPSAKLYVEGYELDFALLERDLRLNIEVDGDHHVDARGKLRRQDVARDRILTRMGWEVLRIPAWLCTWDVGEAINRIAARVDRARLIQ